MKLRELGFDERLAAATAALQRPDCSAARVIRVERDRYLVSDGANEAQAEASGKLLFTAGSPEDLPAVGDWVLVQYHNDGALAIIHELVPRISFLRRKAPGRTVGYQMVAANIDAALIVQSCDTDFNVRRLERYLVMVHEGNVAPVMLLSKTDTVPQDVVDSRMEELRQARINTRVIPCSANVPGGFDEVRATLEPRKTYCLLGSSGVGKSTLLNALLGRKEFETAPVRESDGRGRHTTSRRQMTALENGALIIDTPGMRELGMLGVGESIGENFADIEELTRACRFNDCSHTREAGCALLEARESGVLTEDRYESYMKLMKESAFHQMTYLERRRKDKQFGKMVKYVLKHTRKQ